MASKRLVADNDFGQIIIQHTRRGARNITMRVKPDGLHLTVPPRSLLKKVLEVLQPYRKQLLEQLEQIAPKPVDLSFRIHADCFHLSLASSKLKHFTIRREEEEMDYLLSGKCRFQKRGCAETSTQCYPSSHEEGSRDLSLLRYFPCGQNVLG